MGTESFRAFLSKWQTASGRVRTYAYDERERDFGIPWCTIDGQRVWTAMNGGKNERAHRYQ